MKRILTLLLMIVAIAVLQAATEKMVVRIDNPGAADLQRFLDEGADIASYRPGVYLDLVVGQGQYEELLGEYPNLLVTQTEASLKANLAGERDLPGYRNYSQMVTELMQLQAQYPYLVQTMVIGEGWGAQYAAQNLPNYLDFDHQIWAVKVSANVLQEEDEPAFYFIGEHHAREPISTEVCMSILIHLLENYGTDLSVTDLLNSAEIWFVPLLNPDGHKVVIEQTDVWWRKNIRDNNSNLSFDHQNYGNGYDGVDLNRNYGHYWGYTSATDIYNEATYHGPNSFSEPETQVLRDFLLSKRFLAGISYHSYGEYVLFPYGYVSNVLAPDAAELQALAVEMAMQIPSVDQGFYDPMPSWQLYPVSGSSEDWIYANTGAFAYTIEMATQFIPPAAQMTQIVADHTLGAMTMLNRKNKKMLKGHVTDAETGTPLEATIWVEGIDDYPVWRTPIQSDSLWGSYYRLLPSGVYNVKFIREGYQTYETLATITDNDVSICDAALLPVQAYELSVIVRDDFFEPVTGASVSFFPGDGTVYESGADGRFTVPEFYPGQYVITVSKPGYETLTLTRDVASPSIGVRITCAPVLNEDFELGLSAWQASGSWGRSTAFAHGGTYSLADSPTGNYPNNHTSYCRLIDPLPLSNVQNANLQFWVKTFFPEDADNVSLEYSLNNNTWSVLDFYCGTADWELRSYNLNSFIGQSLWLRFKLFADSYSASNGIFIDDFKLYINADATENHSDTAPELALGLNVYPNPFTDQASLQVICDRLHPEKSDLSIYNLRGQLVKRFDDLELEKGVNAWQWNGLDANGQRVASGVYHFILHRGKQRLAARKAIYLK